MKSYKILCILSLFFLFLSCNDDAIFKSKITEGIPTKARISLKVPVTQELQVTRAGVEDNLNELGLFMYRRGEGKPEFVNLTGLFTLKDSIDYNHGASYIIDKELDLLSGYYNIYAIANWSNSLTPIDLEELKNLTQSQMEKYVLTKKNTSIILTGNSILMSAKASGNKIDGGFVVISDNPDDSNTLSISLKRNFSKIYFNIKVNTQTDPNRNFTITSYSVYNIPLKSHLTETGNVVTTELTDFHNVEGLTLQSGETSFEFFMPENIQISKTDTIKEIWKYREKYIVNDTINSSKFENKTFVNAPDRGTCVVINGYYSDSQNMASVSYTVHLGDFSPTGSLNNYSVKRNSHYKYNITVNGIDNIITEAEKEGDSMGQEGVVTPLLQTFYVDSHYENILLNVSLNTNADGFTVLVRDPYINTSAIINNATEIPDNKADYKWVTFYDHKKYNYNTANSIAPYPGDNSDKLQNVFEFVKVVLGYIKDRQDITANFKEQISTATGDKKKELEKQLKTHIADSIRTFSVYVDEYYYKDKNWLTFVNKGDRTLTVAISSYSSSDKNSVYTDPVLSFVQRPIETVYDKIDKDGYIPFGVETTDETGLQSWVANSVWDNSRSDTDGLSNTKSNINYYGSYVYNSFVNENTNGWIDNKRNTGDNILKKHSKGSPAVYQCMSRNRPSKGTQFEPEDIKWYVPARDQYLYMWLGEDVLSSTAKLYNKDWWSNSFGSRMLLFTSSNSSARSFFGVEGCAYGGYWPDTNQYVRCIRNLKQSEGSSVATPVYEYNKNTNEFSMSTLSDLAIRDNQHSGEYKDKHHERDTDNTLPAKFKVADNNMNSSFIKKFVENIVIEKTILNGGAGYKITLKNNDNYNYILTYYSSLYYSVTESGTKNIINFGSSFDVNSDEIYLYGLKNNSYELLAHIILGNIYSISSEVQGFEVNPISIMKNVKNNLDITVPQNLIDYVNKKNKLLRIKDRNGYKKITTTSISGLSPVEIQLDGVKIISAEAANNGNGNNHVNIVETSALYTFVKEAFDYYLNVIPYVSTDGRTYRISVSYSSMLDNIFGSFYIGTNANTEDVNSKINITTLKDYSIADYPELYMYGYNSYSRKYILLSKFVLKSSGREYNVDYKDISSNTVLSFTKIQVQNGKYCQNYYTEESDASDIGKWRMPNQKELAVLVMSPDITLSSNPATPSSTYFSYGSSTGRPDNFSYDGVIQVWGKDSYVLRCVRDAQ